MCCVSVSNGKKKPTYCQVLTTSTFLAFATLNNTNQTHTHRLGLYSLKKHCSLKNSAKYTYSHLAS